MQENPLAKIPSFGPFHMDEEEFDAAVEGAIAAIPADIRSKMNNVAIFTQEHYVPSSNENPNTVLLGLYEGTPLTERDSWWDAGSLPDRITVFRAPILKMCRNRDEVMHEITVTVVHEIAHHFGISDERLHELGWG